MASSTANHSQQAITFRPAYTSLLLIGATFAVAVCILVLMRTFREKFIVGLFIIADCIMFRRILWGVTVVGETVHIHFPLCPWEDKSFGASEIADVEIVQNPIRLFAYSDFVRLRLKGGRKLILRRMGVGSFAEVVNLLKDL